MSMLDAFFSKGFKGPKCKTLLKLTIPRIKLLRNRREVQLKQMRRDIAKLLETGQEATARIRVEHIVREENMMSAQEILELYCELISVRLPIIETQKECPLDLKEAISTICFAAPRCSDLPELLQVQMLFASKYGKEFVQAATELMPDCGVNRQVIELLSVRAPSAETKLKLLKDIAEEHELDWDPSATETEFTKSHEDLLNGPNQFISGSKLPLPEEKHTESILSAPPKPPIEEADSDSIFDTLDLPQVPNIPLIPRTGSTEAPEMVLPQYANLLAKESDVTAKFDEGNENTPCEYYSGPQVALQDTSLAGLSQSEPSSHQQSNVSVDSNDKQFLPFMSPPSLSSASFSVKEKPAQTIPTLSRTISDAREDLQDVLAAARDAAESAEHAAAAARSAASLAEVRISEIMKKRNNQVAEDPPLDAEHTAVSNRSTFDRGQSFADSIGTSHFFEETENQDQLSPQPPSYDLYKVDREVGPHSEQLMEKTATRQFQRLTSLDEDPYLSYPNLFTSSGTNTKSENYSEDNSPPTNKAE